MAKAILQILIALIALSLAHAADSVLSVSVAVPTGGGDRWLLLHQKGAHFHVIVSNISDRPQRVWKEWCSWGYYSLTFEITDGAGKSWTVKKKNREWTKNFPDWWSLEPRENLVLDVYFADSDAWRAFPIPLAAPRLRRSGRSLRSDPTSGQKNSVFGRARSPLTRRS